VIGELWRPERTPHTREGKKGNFLMVITANGIARGCVGKTAARATAELYTTAGRLKETCSLGL